MCIIFGHRIRSQNKEGRDEKFWKQRRWKGLSRKRWRLDLSGRVCLAAKIFILKPGLSASGACHRLALIEGQKENEIGES